MQPNEDLLKTTLSNCREALIQQRSSDGRWHGELSSSAVATAVASFALNAAGKTQAAQRGRAWLEQHRNSNGGWGDSPESPSNFTATLLSRCALDLPTGDPEELRAEILAFYGRDRTFSVPILTMCMLANKLGTNWKTVPQLPFELAVFPHKLYRFLNLPVVSYALPALIAIGLVRHHHAPEKRGFFRSRLIPKMLNILASKQPTSGGFLEAAPLTGFIAMSLISAGYRTHPVTQSAIRFLEETMRPDGSWPIDVDLSNWVTSLSIRALDGQLEENQKAELLSHLSKTQWNQAHPFTHAEPGGWGWTHHDGGAPDADDTAAALIALRQLEGPIEQAERGLFWLLELRNRDGGMPTFCRGWGKLPFDRSCADLTAHSIRAFLAWRDLMNENLYAAAHDAILEGLGYLNDTQRPDGSWVPLWFGNQSHPKQENPVYGTARVLEALVELDETEFPAVTRLRARGMEWLNRVDIEPLCIEELALVVGLTGRGLDQLIEQTNLGTSFPAAPIGLYFASLWYSEKLYPILFTLEALERLQRRNHALSLG